MGPRNIAASTAIALAVITSAPGTAGAAVDDGDDKRTQLAEAQFEVHLLTNTDLVPSDVTCAAPPTIDPGGSMLCFALIGSRQSVAALAVLNEPGVYRFISVQKLDPVVAPAPAPGPQPGPGEGTPQPQTPAPQNDVDAAILVAVDDALRSVDEISETLREFNPEIASIDVFDFYSPTATLLVSVTTSAQSQGVRDEIAFSVTDLVAYLWEPEQPARDAAATIFPRLEVTIDGQLYGSSYDMMVGVADYTLSFLEWVELARGDAPAAPAGRLSEPRVGIKGGGKA